MKKITIFFFTFLLSLTCLAQESEKKPKISLEGMKTYYLGLLYRGDAPTPENTEDLEKLQEAHLNHIFSLAESGKLVMAGPITDNGTLRGILVFATETLEEAKALAEEDPAVKAGRLKLEIHPWYSKSGTKLP